MLNNVQSYVDRKLSIRGEVEESDLGLFKVPSQCLPVGAEEKKNISVMVALSPGRDQKPTSRIRSTSFIYYTRVFESLVLVHVYIHHHNERGIELSEV
jgi:hypothetical protein